MNHRISDTTIAQLQSAATATEHAARDCRQAALDYQARADQQHRDADVYAQVARDYRTLIADTTGQAPAPAERQAAETQAAVFRAGARLVAAHPDLPLPEWRVTDEARLVGRIWDYRAHGSAVEQLQQWAVALGAEVEHSTILSSTKRDAYQVAAEVHGVQVRIWADDIKEPTTPAAAEESRAA